jgi:DNA-binding transcriptional ArsR family regulator
MRSGHPEELLIHSSKITKGVFTLRTINHLLRQEMLQLIHEKKRVTVTEIHKKFRIEQSVASEHLALLRKEKFVLTERHGRFIFYSVNYENLKKVHLLCEGLIGKYPGQSS